MPDRVHVVGGGLAGCEAALQLARLGFDVVLHEMRPAYPTPVHRGGDLAEIVCSNSLKSTDPETASGLFKAELDLLGCRLLALARQAAVPAGAALAVDRELFSRLVTEAVAAAGVTVVRERVDAIPPPGEPWILATGPLTDDALAAALATVTGHAGLHFYDAIAPTVTAASLDMDRLFRAARYDRGPADYLNAPLDEAQYTAFVEALVSAARADVHELDREELFSGCLPIEEIARGGPRSLAFGPLRPVGLVDPRTGRRPHAVVQLRQENREGTLFGLVGFQTRLRRGEQRRVFRMIPGLEQAEFVRYGQLHRNFFVDTPRVLTRGFALPAAPHVRLAGQVTGVEGYVESIASGLVTAWWLAAERRGIALPDLPPESLLGALLHGFLFDTTAPRLTPMNVHFGLLPPPPDAPGGRRGRRERRRRQAERALAALRAWRARPEVAALVGPGDRC